MTHSPMSPHAADAMSHYHSAGTVHYPGVAAARGTAPCPAWTTPNGTEAEPVYTVLHTVFCSNTGPTQISSISPYSVN